MNPSTIPIPSSGRTARAPAPAMSRWLRALPAGRRGALLVAGLWLAGAPARGLDPGEAPANYIARQWTTEQGLPHNSVRRLLQTSDGFLWLGTNFGLARFDGLTFTVFNESNTPVMQNNQVTSLAETGDGSLWAGMGTGLLRYRDGHFTWFSKADGIKNEVVNTVCVAADGSLWIGGREGIVRWVQGAFVDDLDLSAYDLASLRNLHRDRHGAMWVAAGGIVLRYQDGRFTAFGSAEGITTNRVETVREDADGNILVVTQNGLFQFTGGRFVPFALGPQLSSRAFSTTLVDGAGNLWVGSVGGLDRCYGGEVVPYTDASGNKLGVVDTLLEDREGSLWAGTSAGLFRFTDRRAHSLTAEDGSTGSLVTTVSQTHDGSIWIATWGGGITRLQGDVREHYTKGSPLSHETVTAVYEAPDGMLWFGTRGSSIDRFDGNRVTTYVYASGVPSSRPVTAMLTDDDGTLLLGIANRGLLQLRDEQIVPVPEAAELVKATVRTLFRTRDGGLYLGTDVGLYRWRADRTWEAVELPGLAGPVIVRDVQEEADGTLWFATEQRGLVRWGGGQARAYGTDRGMFDDILFSVIDDGFGFLWVNSGRGIARIRKSELNDIDAGRATAVNCVPFGRADGLLSASAPGSGVSTACYLADGRLLFATDRGVGVIDPRAVQGNALPPPVVINAVIADDVPLNPRDVIRLRAGTNRLEIRYTALSLVAPERLRFRYQLEGSDNRWVEAGTDRSAHYTHLEPGRYTFRVLACNNDGVWNETGTALAFTLVPFYYQTAGFWALVLLVLGGVVAGAVWWRLRELHQRQEELTRNNAELDRRVQQRTAELSQSRDELEQREQLFRLIFEHAPVGIAWMRADLGAGYHVNATFRRILDLAASTLPDTSAVVALIHPEDAPRHAAQRARIVSGAEDSFTLEQRYVRHDGRVVWATLSVAVIRDENGGILQEIAILEDATARKQAEADLAEGNRRLVEVSRQAGMAEIATGVLHNVGNVLNSVNVSASLVAERLQRSEFGTLGRVCALLREHDGKLPAFFAEDPRGRKLPGFLDTLHDHLTAEQRELVEEIDHLRRNVEHIKGIVAMQQTYAKVSGVTDQASVADLVEDALRINAGGLAHAGLEVVRDFQLTPVIEVEKHKVLQILVNLVANAKHACVESARADGRITVRITGDERRVRITVLDNGVGIRPENLTRIFSHGFTTREHGHGFGLHSGALAAREMGGALAAASAGPGQGAVFTLELPRRPGDRTGASRRPVEAAVTRA